MLPKSVFCGAALYCACVRSMLALAARPETRRLSRRVSFLYLSSIRNKPPLGFSLLLFFLSFLNALWIVCLSSLKHPTSFKHRSYFFFLFSCSNTSSSPLPRHLPGCIHQRAPELIHFGRAVRDPALPAFRLTHLRRLVLPSIIFASNCIDLPPTRQLGRPCW